MPHTAPLIAAALEAATSLSGVSDAAMITSLQSSGLHASLAADRRLARTASMMSAKLGTLDVSKIRLPAIQKSCPALPSIRLGQLRKPLDKIASQQPSSAWEMAKAAQQRREPSLAAAKLRLHILDRLSQEDKSSSAPQLYKPLKRISLVKVAQQSQEAPCPQSLRIHIDGLS